MAKRPAPPRPEAAPTPGSGQTPDLGLMRRARYEHDRDVNALAERYEITPTMIEKGYEAARELLPVELRPPHDPISPPDLMHIVSAVYRAMEAARAGR